METGPVLRVPAPRPWAHLLRPVQEVKGEHIQLQLERLDLQHRPRQAGALDLGEGHVRHGAFIVPRTVQPETLGGGKGEGKQEGQQGFNEQGFNEQGLTKWRKEACEVGHRAMALHSDRWT